MRLSSIIALWLITLSSVSAQVKVYLEYTDAPEEFTSISSFEAQDSLEVHIEINRTVQGLRSQGYLLANLDNIEIVDSLYYASLYVGPIHRWMHIDFGSVPTEFLQKAGISQNQFEEKAVNLDEFENHLEKIQLEAAKKGYPLATLTTDSVRIIDGWLNLRVNYVDGAQILYDSLLLDQNIVKSGFLSSYLSLKKNQVYNVRDIDRIPQLLSQLEFITLDTLPKIYYSNNSAFIQLEVSKRKSNKIDAIIGLLPETGGLKISGYVDLQLKNLFKSGKSLDFLWRQYDRQSQLLEIKYHHPNFVKSPIGFDADFRLLKQDTSFLDRHIGVNAFALLGLVRVNFLADFQSSRIIESEASFAEVQNFDLQYYGAGIEYFNFDNPINPSSGFQIKVHGSLGNKQLRGGNFDPDTTTVRTVQSRITGQGEFNIPIGGPFVLNANANGGVLFNGEALYVNDLFRVGGLKSLRGFNELEFYASSFLITGVELRMLFGPSSRLFAFFDQGFLNYLNNDSDNPFGLGLGMNLGLGNGNLQLIYALGKSSQQSLSLSQGKVHIGYAAQF